MNKLNKIYNYSINYLKLIYEYIKTDLKLDLMEFYNYIYNFILENKSISILISILIVLLILRLFKKKHKNLKRSKNRKSKPGFYNTGYKYSFSFRDIVKFKLRLVDYCDQYGIRYSYLISIKIFNFEICRMKYTDQKGKVYKRKVRFGS